MHRNKPPHDLIVLLALIGWFGLFAFLASQVIEWIATISWFQ